MSLADPLAGPEALRASLLARREDLPSPEAVIHGQEPWITPTLLEILESPELQSADGPGGGWGPIYAARLLCARGDARAIEPLLRVLVDGDELDRLGNDIELHLPELGPAVLEPALAAYAAHTDGGVRNRLLGVLCSLDVSDERVFALLVDELGRVPGLAAGCLAEIGDRRALAPLARALDALEPQADASPLSNDAIVELASAIEELGGTLTRAQQAKLDAVRATARAFRDELEAILGDGPARKPAARPARPGRNAPCWCGSARKDKKCHLDEDEQQARA
jgi:hypothetical protein